MLSSGLEMVDGLLARLRIALFKPFKYNNLA